MPGTLVETLAEHVAATSVSRLPEPVRARGRQAVLDAVEQLETLDGAAGTIAELARAG